MPQFDSNAFWGMAGIIVGILVATFFFVIGKKKTLLQHRSTATPLITNKMAEIPGISITIHGQPVKNLVSTTIKFRNLGNQPIASTDFVEQDKLRIVLTGELYSYDVSKGNQKLVPTLDSVDNKTINIAFENLKPKQYFTVTILHDGSSDVFGELKTGEMQEYNDLQHSAIIKLIVTSIFLLLVLAIAVYDHFSNGRFTQFLGASASAIECLLVIFSGVAFGAVATAINDIQRTKDNFMNRD